MGDWNTESTVIGNRGAGGARAAKSTTAINAARRRGKYLVFLNWGSYQCEYWCLTGDAVSTEQKYGAGQNKHSVTSMNTAKLDQETEELKHDKVSLDVGKLIMKGRQQKGLTQKDLATKICEKPQVVNEYESGKVRFLFRTIFLVRITKKKNMILII